MRCRNCTPIPEEVRAVADLLERRATVSILLAAHEGALRFNEFLQVIGRIPPATLASRLSDLEQAGVLDWLVDRVTAGLSVTVYTAIWPSPRYAKLSSCGVRPKG